WFPILLHRLLAVKVTLRLIRHIRSQGLFQVSNDILNIFDTYGEAQEGIGGAARLANIFRNRAMCHRRRMANKRFHAAETFCQSEYLEAAYHRHHIGVRSLELE